MKTANAPRKTRAQSSAKLEQSNRIDRERQPHHSALEALRAPLCKTPGLKLFRALRLIESEVHNSTTAQCNGAVYNGQPFRPDCGADGEESEDSPWQIYLGGIKMRVSRVFGHLPAGFFVNGDARGHALKINPERGTIPEGMVKDWGSYGILAPTIE